jgi:Tfp pilus assembly protein PilX
MTPRKPHLPSVRARLRAQEGISLIITIGVLFVTSLLLVGAFTASDGEIHLTATNTSQKKAYYAAEAGVENYENHLTEDGNYLSYCTSPTPANSALNQLYKENTNIPLTASELKTTEVPPVEEKPSEEKYAIQLIPAESDEREPYKKCNSTNLVESMVEEKGSATGTFRIAVTGFSGKEKSTIVATFRNANFVSFIWYSKYETFDTAIYGTPVRTTCEAYYGKRPTEPYCENNFFVAGESVNGPMHTEDHVGICGNPVFGRTKTDRIEFGQVKTEISEPAGYSSEGLNCGGASPQFKGTHILPNEVKELEPPPGDEELLHVVEPAYLFEGKTEIVMSGSTLTITNKGLTKPNLAYPPSGVIYVETKGTCSSYSPFGPVPSYAGDTECGNAYVHGEYTSSLTVAAQNDVVINGNLTTPHQSSGAPTSNAMVGLVANNFVRVYHPVTETYTKTSGTACAQRTYRGLNGGSHTIPDKQLSPTECHYLDEAVNVGGEAVDACDAPNSVNALHNPTIYAAILALKHAFVVDNYNCGSANLESLNVYGAIAGLFSNGLTGVFEGSSNLIHGYPYDANYDNRLQVEEPPHFLNPIQASWYIQRETTALSP